MRCSTFINLGRENWHSNKRCIREEPDRPHLSLTRELGLVVLICYLFLPYILAVLRRIPLLEEGGELHRVITRLNSLHSTIQSPVAGEEISGFLLYTCGIGFSPYKGGIDLSIYMPDRPSYIDVGSIFLSTSAHKSFYIHVGFSPLSYIDR